MARSALSVNLHGWADKDTYIHSLEALLVEFENEVKDYEFGLPIIISLLFPCFLALIEK